MSEPSSEFSPQDQVFDQFFRDWTAAADRDAVLAAYVNEHPDLAEELRQLAAADDLMRRSRPPAEDAPPARLGEFRILRRVAIGGMGEIYEAVQESLGRRVAVKIIRRGRLSAAGQARFLREQEVLASLHQTHIVPIHTAGQEGALQFFAMPFIDGAALHHVIGALHRQSASPSNGKTPTLADLVARASSATNQPAGVGHQPEAQAKGHGQSFACASGLCPTPRRPLALSSAYYRSVAAVMADAADALHHAHEAGVLHRDMKPSNLMVDRTGQCWIIDFGLAAHLASGGRKPLDDAATTGSADGPLETLSGDGVLGTPQYMAPEQWRKDKLDSRTDVWGLGATLYELLTLHRPFEGKTKDAIRDAILTRQPTAPRRLVRSPPGDLAAICLKALQKDSERRYPSARAFADDLRRWLRREPTLARPGVGRRLWLWVVRNKGWAAAIALALTAFLGAVFGQLQVMRERENYEKDRAVRSEGESKKERRDALLRQLQLVRLMELDGGVGSSWYDQAWKLVQDSAALRRDDELRNQAAALLAGLDVHLVTDLSGQFDASSAAFDRDGRRLLLGGSCDKNGRPSDGARLWDGVEVGPGDRVPTLAESALHGSGPVTFRADGAPLQLAPDADDRLRLILWNVAAQRRAGAGEFRLGTDDKPEAPDGRNYPVMALAPDGSLVAASAVLRDGSSRTIVWDAATGQTVRQIAAKATAAALAADGSCLALGDEDGRVVVWPLPDGEPVALPSAGRALIDSLAFGRSARRPPKGAPDRRNWLLAAGDAGGMVTIWDVDRGAVQAYCRGSQFDVYALAFSPDGATLASSGRYDARLWDVAAGRLLLKFHYHDFATGLAFSADGRKLARTTVSVFAPRQGGAEIWALEDGRGIRTLRGLSNPVARVCLSPDGRFLAGLSDDWQAAVWDLRSGALIRLLDAPHGVVADHAGLAFSPDGTRFACASGTEARLWNLDASEPQSWKLPLGLHDGLVFDPAGNRLLLFRVEYEAGARPFQPPPTCCVRDLLGPNPEAPILTIRDFTRRLDTVAPTPDGRWVVVHGSSDPDGKVGEVRAYEVGTGREVWSAAARPTADLGHLPIDPTGASLVFDRSDGRGTRVETATGRPIGTLPEVPNCLGPGAAYWCRLGDDGRRSFILHRQDAEAPLVALGIDRFHTTGHALFSRQGDLLIWGDADGSVAVCNLPEVRSRLQEVGLGW